MFIKEIKFIAIIALSVAPVFSMEGEENREIRFYTPPLLKNNNFGRGIICYRPEREGGPNITVEEQNAKKVFHNYGHGGYGWTLAPGSCKYAVQNLLLERYNLPKKEPIAVIGAGIMGLLTTYHLLESGFPNITIFTKEDNGQTIMLVDLLHHHP